MLYNMLFPILFAILINLHVAFSEMPRCTSENEIEALVSYAHIHNIHFEGFRTPMGGGTFGFIHVVNYDECQFILKCPKVVPAYIQTTPNTLDYEFSMLEKFQYSPYIVHIYGRIRTCIAMEFYDTDLDNSNIAYDGTYSYEDRIHFALHIIAGLQTFHDEGYVYFDMKPSNILLSKRKKQLVITDLATLKEEGLTSQVSLLFSGPEPLKTRAHDIYGLGQTLKTLFYGMKSRTLVERYRNRVYDPTTNNPAVIEKVNPSLIRYMQLMGKDIRMSYRMVEQMEEIDAIIYACTEYHDTKRLTIAQVKQRFENLLPGAAAQGASSANVETRTTLPTCENLREEIEVRNENFLSTSTKELHFDELWLGEFKGMLNLESAKDGVFDGKIYDCPVLVYMTETLSIIPTLLAQHQQLFLPRFIDEEYQQNDFGVNLLGIANHTIEMYHPENNRKQNYAVYNFANDQMYDYVKRQLESRVKQDASSIDSFDRESGVARIDTEYQCDQSEDVEIIGDEEAHAREGMPKDAKENEEYDDTFDEMSDFSGIQLFRSTPVGRGSRSDDRQAFRRVRRDIDGGEDRENEYESPFAAALNSARRNSDENPAAERLLSRIRADGIPSRGVSRLFFHRKNNQPIDPDMPTMVRSMNTQEIRDLERRIYGTANAYVENRNANRMRCLFRGRQKIKEGWRKILRRTKNEPPEAADRDRD